MRQGWRQSFFVILYSQPDKDNVLNFKTLISVDKQVEIGFEPKGLNTVVDTIVETSAKSDIKDDNKIGWINIRRTRLDLKQNKNTLWNIPIHV